MGMMKFTGVVTGYTKDEKGKIHLSVEDTSLTDDAKIHTKAISDEFNPNSSTHGYGAKDVPCDIRPCLTAYRFTVEPEQAAGVPYGAQVEVEVEVYNMRKVRFMKKYWGGIPELGFILRRISVIPESRHEKPSAK